MPLIIKKQHLLILGILGVIMAIVRRHDMNEMVSSLILSILFFISYARMRKKGREEGRR